MCFSNLPVEFDEDGDPRLAEADDEGHDHDPEDTVHGDGLDPEARYREILDDLPDRARDRLDSEEEHTALVE